MERRIAIAFAIVTLALAAVSCQQQGSPVPPAPTSQPTVARPAATTVATLVPTLVPSTVAPMPTVTAGTAEDALRRSVDKFEKVASYEFALGGVHHWTLQSAPQTWRYSGSGAYAAPDRVRWHWNGQADTMMDVISVAGQTRCADTRGVLGGNCSLAWGGPLPGTSPFTVIAYLRFPDQVVAGGAKPLDGRKYDYFTFTPDKSKISALSAAHAQEAAKVLDVQGEVWVDTETGLPRREVVKVKAISRAGQEESMDVTVDFSGYGQPVDISLPNKTGG